MKKNPEGKIYSLTDRLKKEEAKEVAEIGEPTTAMLIRYVVDEYLMDEKGFDEAEKGQQRLMGVLQKKVHNAVDREYILDLINELTMADGFEPDLEEEAQNADEEFGLVEILGSVAHRTKDQLIKEINEASSSGLKKIKSAAASQNEAAPVLKFPPK